MLNFKQMRRSLVGIFILLSSIGVVALVAKIESTSKLNSDTVEVPLFEAELTEDGRMMVLSFLSNQDFKVISRQDGRIFLPSNAERQMATALLASEGLPPIETIRPYKSISLTEFETPGWAWGHRVDGSQEKILASLENIRESLLLLNDIKEVKLSLDTSNDDFQPTSSKEVVTFNIFTESSPKSGLVEGVKSLVIANTKADLLPGNIKVVISNV